MFFKWLMPIGVLLARVDLACITNADRLCIPFAAKKEKTSGEEKAEVERTSGEGKQVAMEEKPWAKRSEETAGNVAKRVTEH